jgi:hypothetical protein
VLFITYIKCVFTIPEFAVCPHFRSSTRTKVQVKINKTVYTLHVDSVQLTLQISALKLKTLMYMAVNSSYIYNENEYKMNRTYCSIQPLELDRLFVGNSRRFVETRLRVYQDLEFRRCKQREISTCDSRN